MSYDDPIGDGRWGGGRGKPRSPRAEDMPGTGPRGERTLADMSIASIQREFDRQVAQREEAVRSREEAVQRAQKAADRFELDKGHRPGFELPQKGLVTEWELWHREQAAKERAALEREHDRELERRRAETEQGVSEMRQRRAELNARIRQERPTGSVRWEGARGEARSR